MQVHRQPKKIGMSVMYMCQKIFDYYVVLYNVPNVNLRELECKNVYKNKISLYTY